MDVAVHLVCPSTEFFKHACHDLGGARWILFLDCGAIGLGTYAVITTGATVERNELVRQVRIAAS